MRPAPALATGLPALALTLALASALGVAACAGNGGTGPEVQRLTVGPGAVTLLTGDTVRVTARSADGQLAGSVRWSSSDPDVATVADGLVTARSPGAVTISASTQDGGGEGETRFWVARGSGHRVPELAPFDSIIPRVMRDWQVPGGAVAVIRDGRLIMARGYGWADEEAGVVAGPDHLFRIASVSKPLTAVAVLRLHQEGRLDLDDPAFPLLQDLDPPAGSSPDPRLGDITIRHLLHHAGGWNRDETFDPMFRPLIAAEAVGAPAPASAETVIRYMMGEPLQSDPGAAFAYSNLGYAILGRVIERVTGQSYEAYMRGEILGPAGAGGMRIGSSLPESRAQGEAAYYDPGVVSSVFDPGQLVPVADGGFHLEAMDAHGGWIGSVVDLLRFLTALESRPGEGGESGESGAGSEGGSGGDGGSSGYGGILDPETLETMLARPSLWDGSAYHYAMGWLVRPAGGDANWWHDGSLPGTTALLVRAHNGLGWAALFNARAGGAQGSFAGDLDQAIWKAVGQVTSWPAHDRFEHHD